MGTEILINVQPLETRVAFLEDGVLTDFELERERRVVGSLYLGHVTNVLPGMDAAFVDIGLRRNAFIYVSDVDPAMRPERARGSRGKRFGSIGEALTPGDELVVQVVRPPVGSKGPRVTTRLTLQGRFVVLMVRDPGHLGVSRQIDDRAEHKRLRKLAQRLRPLEHGLVVRTDAQGQTEEALRAEVEALTTLWRSVDARAAAASPPQELHRELGLVGRVVRDRLTHDVDRAVIDSTEDFERCRQLLAEHAPGLVPKLELAKPTPPLFDAFGVEQQIAQALARRVQLPSGGQLALDETEALTTIDVDTGRFVGSGRPADTILQTNLEAGRECARQIRLRDLSGIIIIDFIDMDRVRDRIRVMDALEAELAQDTMRPRIVHLSPLGLVELTRRRRGQSLSQMMRVACPYCSGLGVVCSATTVAAETRRELLRRVAQENHEAALLTAHPEVAAALLGHEGETAAELEAKTGVRLFLIARADAHAEESELDTGALEDVTTRHTPPEAGQVFEVSLHTDQVVPHGHPLYAICGGYLVLLPALTGREADPIHLRITEPGRWFCRSELASA